MTHVKLSIQFPAEAVLRQTPGGAGRWGDCVFHVNDPVPECDCWVVYDMQAELEETVCPPGNVILITGEPPSLKRYDRRFLAQFGLVVTCHENLEHPNVMLRQPGLPWHVGRRQRGHVNLGFGLGYDQQKHIGLPPKDRMLSVICSTVEVSDGHRRRNRFVEALQARFGDRIDVFGRGRREIEDKWEALGPYKYTVVLENSSYPHYWTEKIADAFLAGAFPFYFGCPNLADYFPAGAFQPIDLEDMDRAMDMAEVRIREDAYTHARAELRRAKELVLDEYNLFALMADLCDGLAIGPKERVRIYPRKRGPPVMERLRRKLRGGLRRLWS